MPTQGRVQQCLRAVDITRPTPAYDGRRAIYLPILKKAIPDIYREELAWISRLPESLFEIIMDYDVRSLACMLGCITFLNWY